MDTDSKLPPMPEFKDNTWVNTHEYHEAVMEYISKRNAVEAVDREPRIIIMGHEVHGEEPVAPQIHEWGSLFDDNGYVYKVGYAQSFMPAKNSRSRDKLMDWSYIEGARRGRPKVHISYGREVGGKSWVNAGSWIDRTGGGKLGLKEIQDEVRNGR